MKKTTHSYIKYKTMAVIAGVLAVSLALPAAVSLFARDTLPGIEEYTEEIAGREDPTLRILEIVPDRSLSRVGYYFGGQEPILLKEDDGSPLFDAWDDGEKEWKPWQSILESYGNQTDREYYVNHMMEQATKDPLMMDLVTVSGNIVTRMDHISTVSGNIVTRMSNTGTVSGNVVNGPEAMSVSIVEGTETETADGLSDAPLMLSTYKEVTEEQYLLSPGEYGKYEVEERDRKGYFKHIDSEEYGGARYDVTFEYYGEFQGGETGSFYRVTEALLIPDAPDSAWDNLLTESAYRKEGTRYVYCGAVGDVIPAAVNDSESRPENAIPFSEDELQEPAPDNAGENGAGETAGEGNTEEGNKGEGNREESTEGNTDNAGNGGAGDSGTGNGAEGGSQAGTEGTEGTGGNAGESGQGTGASGDASGLSVDASGLLADDSGWRLFSAPSAAEYYYLKMERVTTPAAGDGNLYYRAHFTPSEYGKWSCEFTADDDPFADTVHTPAMTIYYEGGFRNLEWFRRYALDMEETDFGSFGAQVTTLTVADLNNAIIQDGFTLEKFDFISIRDGEYTDVNGTLKKGFLDGNDLDLSTAEKLFESIMTSEIPVVLDSSVVFSDRSAAAGAQKAFHTEMKDKKPNLWRLAALLAQQSPDRFLPEKGTDGKRPPFTFDGNPSVNWTDIEKGTGFPEDRDNNYVNQNIYCLYKDTFIHPDFEKKALNDQTLDQAAAEAAMEGFEDVLLEIESENLYREADAGYVGDLLSTQIKQSTIIRYIINYANQRATYLKTKINILDIEPCYPDEDSFPLTKKDVMKWLSSDAPITEDDIQITTMSVAEFIGRNEDLNAKYDLIYIGTDADKLNVDKKTGRTVFNDETMNGLVYFHTGDYRYASAMLGGQLNTEYGKESNRSGPRLYEYIKVRYSGLDLTESKMKELISYVDASYPVVLSEDFYTKDAEGDTVIDEGYIDNSSYMYEFAAKMQKDGRKNVFSRKMLGGGEGGGKANVRLFSFYLNRPKLELLKQRVESSSQGDNGVYNIDEKDGEYTLEYGFTISNIGAASSETRYRCELYIDVNADGKFSPLERMEDISVSAGGESVPADQLSAGVPYTVRRTVPDGYRGVLAWKLKVSQVNNGNIRASMTGYSKTVGMEPESIRVLQICRDELWWDGSTPWVSPGKGWWTQENNRRMDLQKEFSDENSNYYKLLYGGRINGVDYAGIQEDFDIDVKCVTISEFEEMYEEAKDKSSVLRDYNMLILGFSDCYGNLKESTINGPGGITEFIDSGKSVLFAHDTTSYTNFNYGNYGYPNNNFNPAEYGAVDHSGKRKSNYSHGRFGNDIPWSYELNRFVRPLTGMDRYGINELNISKNENGEVVSVGNTARSRMLKEGKALTEGDGNWGMLTKTSHDIAWKPGSERKETVPEVQGYTYTIIGFKDNNQSRDLSYPDVAGELGTVKNTLLNYDFGKYFNSKNGNLADGAGDSVMKATMLNEGQITTYPFALQKEFTVSDTHGQYYQLDMDADDDGDGESDLVVWYCLGENEGGKRNPYSISPNDAVNNYYIYNKGNITYTGMGHWGRDSAKPKYVEEAKLFINTIISAYTASIKPSEVKIIDEKTKEKISDIYNYYDIGNDAHLDSALADYQKVYFTVRDTNFVKGIRNLAAAFYLEAADGEQTLTLHGEDYKVNPLKELTVYAADQDDDDGNDAVVDPSALTSGGVYYVRVPRGLFEEGKTRQAFFVESSSRINRYNEEIVTPSVFDRVDLVKLQLFELN